MGKFEDGADNITGLSVTALQPIMVTPAETTPKEVLYMSNIDSQDELRVTGKILHVYGACPTSHVDPVHVIRDAISKALVYYYPLAGRMRKTVNGKLEVCCTGEGAVFVEGTANCSVEEVGYLAQLTPCLKRLLYEYPTAYEHHDIPPLVMQNYMGLEKVHEQYFVGLKIKELEIVWRFDLQIKILENCHNCCYSYK